MIILHCMKKHTWEELKHTTSFGKPYLEQEGFIHCSSIEYLWRVAPNFRTINEPLVLLCIDTEKLYAPLKWEDGDSCGRLYPHVYGEINTSAVIDVLDYLKDSDGNYIKNPEFDCYPNK